MNEIPNDIIEELQKEHIKYEKEQLDFLNKTIGKDILDIDINKVFELKIKALIEEQKDDIDEHGLMRILVDEDMIDELYLRFRQCANLCVFNECYRIIKLEITNIGHHFIYLQE